MTRQSTIENRLGRIEQALDRNKEDREEANRRAKEDRDETNRKIDAQDQKLDTVLVSVNETAGRISQLSQIVDSGTRTVERLSTEARADDCGNRLKGIEGWAKSVDSRLERIEQASAARDARIKDVENGVSDFRKLRKGIWSGVWQIALAAVGGGGLVKLLDHWLK